MASNLGETWDIRGAAANKMKKATGFWALQGLLEASWAEVPGAVQTAGTKRIPFE